MIIIVKHLLWGTLARCSMKETNLREAAHKYTQEPQPDKLLFEKDPQYAEDISFCFALTLG